MKMTLHGEDIRSDVRIPIGAQSLEGELWIPERAQGIVLFAHGSGSSRHSPRNQFVAQIIRDAGTGTLLFDLLTRAEEREDDITGELRFNIPFLAERLVQATSWLKKQPGMEDYGIGYFGSSTGGGAALMAAAELGAEINAVVSRGGRPDLAAEALPNVKAPTLLIVGEYDEVVIELNEQAFAELNCEKEMKIIPRATHLFEEPGALEKVANTAAAWFHDHLRKH